MVQTHRSFVEKSGWTPSTQSQSLFILERRMAEKNSGRKVVIPVDESEHSERAFNWYCENLHGKDDTLYVLHVPELPLMPAAPYQYGIAYSLEWQKAVDKSVEKAKKLIEKFTKRCEQKKLNCKLFVDSKATPGEAICKLANDESADLTVMGSRGQNTLRRTLLGSTSDYVLHHSHNPVTVIPPPKPESHK